MKALGVGHVSGREIIVELDVGREAYSGERAFEKVVAEQGVVRNSIFKDLREGPKIVDPFSDKGTLCKEVLVYVRDYVRVWIESCLSRKELGEPGTRGRCERDSYARLNERIAFHDTTSIRIDNRTVHGVGDSRNQLFCHVAAQLGVTVESYHISNTFELL
jgi:hypothetical protein